MINCDYVRAGVRIAAGAFAISLGLVAGSLAAQRAQLALLERFEAGEWEIRDRSSRLPAERRCIGDGRRLIQIRHAQLVCRQYVVEDTDSAVTVHYSCPGQGFGRTRIRFENPRLAQIETQGLANGLPFDFVAEARRLGSCKP